MRVAAIAYTPVNGTFFRQHEWATVGAAGLRGDRAFCLCDLAAGTCAPAAMPGSILALDIVAKFDGRTLSLSGPHGTARSEVADGPAHKVSYHGRTIEVAEFPGACNDLLRAVTGQPYTLCRVLEPGAIQGNRPVSIISSATLRAIAELVGAPIDAARRLRSNLIIDTGDTPFVEDSWIGKTIKIGRTELRPTELIDRGEAMINADIDGAGVNLLTALRDTRLIDGEVRVAVAAEVASPGMIAVGEAVRVEPRMR